MTSDIGTVEPRVFLLRIVPRCERLRDDLRFAAGISASIVVAGRKRAIRESGFAAV